jgi:hypothetical protein
MSTPKSCIALVEEETFYLPHLLAQLARSGRVSQIVLYSPARPLKARWARFKRNASAFGLAGIVVCGLSAALARFLNVFPGRYYSVRKVADAFKIPLLKVAELQDILTRLDSGRAGGTIIFAQISDRIGSDLLSRAEFINKHCGLLPLYRGVYPVYWAMLNDERYLGVTLHRMDGHFDTGPILAQSSIPSHGHSFFGAHHALYDLAAEMILKYLTEPCAGAYPQDPSEGSYFSYPTEAERAALLSKRRLGSPLRLHPAPGGAS